MFSRLDEIIQKCKDDTSVRVVVSKFYVDFHEDKDFLKYLIENWFEGDRIHKFTYNMFILTNFSIVNPFVILILVFLLQVSE